MNWIIAIFIIIAAVVIFKVIFKRKERKNILSFFQKRERVMNESEKKLFDYLQEVIGNHYILLSKVRIEDFVEVDKNQVPSRNRWWGLRNMIKSRHVDFLICDRSTTEPLLAVELDGKSHYSQARQERDQNMDKLYEAIGLPMKHITDGPNSEKDMEDILNILENRPL